MIEIVFLGTSSMVPTKERNQSAVFISYGSHGILIDCGEGTQKQLKLAGIAITKVTKILITHWHSDHALGLPGLISTLGASEYTKTLEIYGPEGTAEHFKNMFRAFVFDRRIKMEIIEIKEPGIFYSGADFSLESLPLEHGIETLGFRFVEADKRKIDLNEIKRLGIPEGPLLGKLQSNQAITWKGKKITPEEATYLIEGKKMGFIADTLPCNNCYKIAKDVDLLISESTYSSKLSDKSEDYSHMTAKQAALIASKSNAKKLILTHFSARYKNTQELEEDARDYFDDVICAKDLMRIRI